MTTLKVCQQIVNFGDYNIPKIIVGYIFLKFCNGICVVLVLIHCVSKKDHPFYICNYSVKC